MPHAFLVSWDLWGQQMWLLVNFPLRGHHIVFQQLHWGHETCPYYPTWFLSSFQFCTLPGSLLVLCTPVLNQSLIVCIRWWIVGREANWIIACPDFLVTSLKQKTFFTKINIGCHYIVWPSQLIICRSSIKLYPFSLLILQGFLIQLELIQFH